jgi:hypothetical protein
MGAMHETKLTRRSYTQRAIQPDWEKEKKKKSEHKIEHYFTLTSLQWGT